MMIYCVAVTFLAAFLAGFLTADLSKFRKKQTKPRVVFKSDAEKTLENFLNYNGEIQ
jgi:hypothetical protein